MGTFAEMKGAVPSCPAIESEQRRALWVTDYDIESWIGVRSGIVLFRGEKCSCQFVATREGEFGPHLQYAVLRLSTDQLEQELKWHAHVQRQIGSGQTLDWWIERHRERNKPDYSPCEVLGWFEV